MKIPHQLLVFALLLPIGIYAAAATAKGDYESATLAGGIEGFVIMILAGNHRTSRASKLDGSNVQKNWPWN